MKLSKYNFLRQFDEVTVFFNAMTCALAVVDENFLRVVEDIKNNSYEETKYDPKLISDMKISGCIVEDDVDELGRLEFLRNLSKYDMTKFGLTIAPTLDCNFRCKYCFETHPKGVMSAETQAALIKFVEQRLKNVKKFTVAWYGGEPLLAKEIIYNLSEKFLELCAKENISYSASIVTNASLMDASDVEKFKKYKIRSTQITIDGPKEIHDSRRKNITGESTFDKLIENVNALLNNSLTATIRINIDKENISHVDELLDVLRDKISKYENLRIGFGQVAPYSEVCKSIEDDCFSNEQFADVMLPLYEKVSSHGFKVGRRLVYPSPRVNFCSCAEYANFFVVDNNGLLYKCWNVVGEVEKSCGNIKSFKPDKNYLSWILNNPIRSEKCRDCRYLPICIGSCPNMARNSEDGQPVCGTIKYNLDKITESYYHKLKGCVKI